MIVHRPGRVIQILGHLQCVRHSARDMKRSQLKSPQTAFNFFIHIGL